jgi:hypothetical protein
MIENPDERPSDDTVRTRRLIDILSALDSNAPHGDGGTSARSATSPSPRVVID